MGVFLIKSKIIYDRYKVYEDGRVYSIPLGRYIAQSTYKDEYYRVRLTFGCCNKSKNIAVHRLVFRTFNNEKLCCTEKRIMKTGESLVIDHIDEDKKNNRLSNLRLITHQENIQRGHDRKAHIISAHYLKQAQKWQSVKTIRGVQYRDTGLSRKEAIDKVKYLISVSKGK